jgi:N6-adenosine-specific RNA methylase IME4
MLRDYYGCIFTDPPWPERGGGKIKRGADRHYDLMGLRDIYALHERVLSPVLTDHDAKQGAPIHLYVAVTNNYLAAGMRLIDTLGFRYVTNFAWVKVRKQLTLAQDNEGVIDNLVEKGLGRYTYGSHELILFARRGRAHVPTPKDRRSTVIAAPLGEHSEKPRKLFSVAESISPGPRLEMFARAPREGWDTWGNEKEKWPKKT